MSSRVKLNRVALKDVVDLKLVPRRRQRVQQQLKAVPENSHEPTDNPFEFVSAEDIDSKEFTIKNLNEEKPPETTHDDEKCAATSQRTSKKKYEDSVSGVGGMDLQRPRDRNAHPSPSQLTGSDASLRVVRAPGCGLCGDCKCISPQNNPLGKQGEKNSVSVAGQPTVIEPPMEILELRDRHLKVTLCDIAKNSDPDSHFGYVLPDAFKSKVVHCFKKDMRTGFRLKPCCLGPNKCGSSENSLAKNSKLCPRIQSDSDADTHSSQTETHPNEHMDAEDAETLSSHTTCLFLRDRVGEASEVPPASCLIGEHTESLECKTDFQVVDKASSDTESDFTGAEVHGNKKNKLEDVRSHFTLGLQSSGCDDTSRTIVPSTCCSPCSSAKDDSFPKTPCTVACHPEKESVTLETSEVCQIVLDDPECYTCQRVRVYMGKISCARTYLSWPFHSKSKNHAATETVDGPSRGDNIDHLLNRTEPDSLRAEVWNPVAEIDRVTNEILQRKENVGDSPGYEREENEAKKDGLVDASSLGCAGTSVCVPPFEEKSLASSSMSIPTVSSLSLPKKPHSCTVLANSSTLNGRKTDSTVSFPSPSLLKANEWGPAATPLTAPFLNSSLHSLSATLPPSPQSLFLLHKDKADACSAFASPTPSLSSHKCGIMDPFFQSDNAPNFPCSPSYATSSLTSNSFESNQFTLLLRSQEVPVDDRDVLRECSPPELYHKQTHVTPICQDGSVKTKSLNSIRDELTMEANSEVCFLPPLLSPVASPRGPGELLLPQIPCISIAEEEKETNKAPVKHKTFSAQQRVQSVNGISEFDRNAKLDRALLDCEFRTDDVVPREHLSPLSSDASEDDTTDYEIDEVQGTGKDPKMKELPPQGLLTELSSSPCRSCDNESGPGAVVCESREDGWSSSDVVESDGDKSEQGQSDGQSILDEFTAFEQDILLVDVLQDDSALFNNLPQESLIKMGPIRATEKSNGGSLVQRVTPVRMDFIMDSTDDSEEIISRPWRPQCDKTPTRIQKCKFTATTMDQSDANNNFINGGWDGGQDRSQPIRTLNPLHKPSPPLTTRVGTWITNQANMARHQRSNKYCRFYFSESLSCCFKMCRYEHVPAEGDEQFCIETVTRFINNPMCLQRAGAVFQGYYKRNPPGVHYSPQVLLSLLWALLRAGMVSDVYSVLHVSLAHKIVPSNEFLLALFHHVRERGLMSLVPELMKLTYKMANEGLMLSLDCFDSVKNSPEFHHLRLPVSLFGRHKSSASSSAPLPDNLNLAHAIVEIELCAKQEDWKQMGEVFNSICKSNQSLSQLERVSGHITIALLSEGKDKLVVPFAAFAESVFKNETEDQMNNFLGRIGVSLMLRYHKTHQWAKGQKVVEVLSHSKITYSMLKGLFGNEDQASRCCLITVATKLVLFSGSVEGALNTLRDNDWFLGSQSWPCDSTDLEGRSHVLMRLAEKTSHRDTLEVLSNLPGVKEPNDLVDISRYVPLFNSHLQLCVDRQILSVAADTVDLMLSKNLAVEQTKLQMLLHKLGKQNHWLRAREVFAHSLNVGYYPGVSASPGFKRLFVPSHLGEVELALSFEMFITVNATVILQNWDSSTSNLSITLKRSGSSEREYLSAGSRLLSAASIPQPKLTIHYKPMNSSCDQDFLLDVSSARRWLHNNHLWASEVWTQ